MLRVSLRCTRCRPTHPISVQKWARVAAHCCFNAGQLCTTLALHHPNTDQMHDSSTPASTEITRRLTNVASMLIQRVWRWPNNNPAFCIHRLLRGNYYRGDNLIPSGQKGHYPDTLAQLWNNVGPPSPTLGQHYSNQKPLSSYYGLNDKYNREYYFFWTLVKDKSTWPTDLKRYIRHVHEDWCTEMSCFSHTAPLFPLHRTQTQAK